ncbi:MAG: zinc-dependent metalloprotease [Halovenus sp.]
MSIYRSVRAVTGASGDGPIDWGAVTAAAQASVDPGTVDVTPGERQGYADDVRDARDRVRTVTALSFDLPERVELMNRHHWLEANVDTFRRVLAPLEEQTGGLFGIARVANTGTMAFTLSFLSKHVLGQYDPLLLADGDTHALYFVRPNIEHVAETLDVPYDRFRRWIVFHEVAHAAEFGAAPWLPGHLEASMQDAIEKLGAGSIDREALSDLDTAMTAVEGYAELVMDRAFDEEYDDLRRKLDKRRQGRGPAEQLVRRLLGLSVKRRQYERGKAFFEGVVAARGIEAAGRVWDAPETLPTDEELDDPDAWLRRVDA